MWLTSGWNSEVPAHGLHPQVDMLGLAVSWPYEGEVALISLLGSRICPRPQKRQTGRRSGHRPTGSLQLGCSGLAVRRPEGPDVPVPLGSWGPILSEWGGIWRSRRENRMEITTLALGNWAVFSPAPFKGWHGHQLPGMWTATLPRPPEKDGEARVTLEGPQRRSLLVGAPRAPAGHLDLLRGRSPWSYGSITSTQKKKAGTRCPDASPGQADTPKCFLKGEIVPDA